MSETDEEESFADLAKSIVQVIAGGTLVVSLFFVGCTVCMVFVTGMIWAVRQMFLFLGAS